VRLASRKWTGLGLVGVLLLTGCVTSGRRGVELVYTYDREALLRELQRRCEIGRAHV